MQRYKLKFEFPDADDASDDDDDDDDDDDK